MTKANLNYLERFKNTISIVSNKTGISTKEVEKIIDSFFRNLKSAITDPRMPTIKLTYIGTFKPSINKIDNYLKRSFFMYRSGKLDKDKMSKRVNKVWKIRRRLQDEKRKVNTWKKWKKIKPEDYAKK